MTQAESYVEKRAGRDKLALVRTLALTLLFTASALYEAVHLSSLSDNNVWLHLRAGGWILQTHSVSHQGLFSQYPTLSWMDCSWGYDVLLAAAYKIFGLRAIPLLLMLFKVALAALTFWLARKAKANFWAAASLSAVAQYVIALSQSLPYALSIIFLVWNCCCWNRAGELETSSLCMPCLRFFCFGQTCTRFFCSDCFC